ncbi:transmembrane protein 205-like [Portunus trituberculatus]|uniref:transmembrane protein 205-like n=1 Tax=Portunus trituberculatus TaxID=210409 RepID=UPI001E1CEDCD|nr:transmembrane protein 205-like [Portunus trituberculatus]
MFTSTLNVPTMALAEVSATVTKASGKTLARFRNRFHSISEFRTDEMYKTRPFSALGVFSSSPDDLTRQELDSFVDSTKKEPTKITKAQIKEYGKKYSDYQKNDKKEPAPWYRELMEHSQPAHLVTIVAVVYLAFRLFPDSRRHATEASTLTRLLYIAAVSTVFGSQVWMTFVSGLALFLSVPRHVFAQVQQVLFPLYFLSNAVLMLVAVVTYTRHHPTHLWDNHQMMQGAILVTCFLVNLGIRLYLAPVLTKLITVKMAIEREANIGQEVGSSSPGLLANCPHYMRLYRAFRRTHMIIAVGNMASMAATSLHLYYLATKLCSVEL